jgi:stachyose synthetase
MFHAVSIEYVCGEYGGRVDLAKAYYEGLTKSIAKNFNGNGIIASMQQCNDFFFLGTNQVSMARVGKHLSSVQAQYQIINEHFHS